MMKDDIQRILISQAELERRVAELGAQISADYAGKEPILVSVLRGSYIFMADLTRHIDTFCRVDFMAVSSYGSGTVSSGQVNIIKDLSDSIEGRDVIVVEDILDSGNTLHYLFQLLKARHPASIRLATIFIRTHNTDLKNRLTAAPNPSPPTTWASRSPTSSWWATAWTLTSATATSPISASSSPVSTRTNWVWNNTLLRKDVVSP